VRQAGKPVRATSAAGRLVMFADRPERGSRPPSPGRSQARPAHRRLNGTRPIGPQECFATIAHQVGMISLKLRREQPAHRDVGDRRQPPGAGCRRHMRNASRPFAEKRSTAIGENEFGCDFRTANSHLQRDEPAISVAEHDGLVFAGGIGHGSAIRSATSARPPLTARDWPKPGSSGIDHRNDCDNRERWRRNSPDPTAAMQQNSVGRLPNCAALTVPLARSRSTAVSLSSSGCKVEMPMRKRCVWALIDKFKFQPIQGFVT